MTLRMWGLSANFEYDKNQDLLGSQLRVEQAIGEIQDDANEVITSLIEIQPQDLTILLNPTKVSLNQK